LRGGAGVTRLLKFVIVTNFNALRRKARFAAHPSAAHRLFKFCEFQ
jgi:hypothetical protein